MNMEQSPQDLVRSLEDLCFDYPDRQSTSAQADYRPKDAHDGNILCKTDPAWWRLFSERFELLYERRCIPETLYLSAQDVFNTYDLNKFTQGKTLKKDVAAANRCIKKTIAHLRRLI